MFSARWQLFLAIFLVAVAGCFSSRQPPLPKYPRIDPAAAAKGAMDLYDANHDGRIDADEAKKSPAMVKLLESADTGGDGSLTAEEIAARIKKWSNDQFPLMTLPFSVSLNGQPLAQATMTLEPEPFLVPPLEPVPMTTDASGGACPESKIPPYRGVLFGLYRVRVSKKDAAGQETVPARFNTETELGIECAYDVKGVPAIGTFLLKNP